MGENVDQLLKALTDYERKLFYELLEELRRSNGAIDMTELWKVDYVRKPPTMTEFITDPYWMGGVLKPSEESQGLFPVWKERLVEDFDLDSRIHNLVITGSLGIGKSYVMVVILLYRVTLVVLLRNPQSFFGLGKGSRILYVMLSLTKSVVSETVFGDAQNFMANCPFFLEQCKFDPNKKYTDFSIPIGKGIYLTAGSKGWHIIGRNTMGVCLDEGNWRLESNPDQRAYKLYDEVRTRIKNRFQKVGGYLPAIGILASSARDESAFTERVIGDINRSNDPKVEKVYRYAAYEVKRHSLKLSGRWFKVAYGLKNVEPRLLSGHYDEAGNPLPGEVCEPPVEGATVKLVPVDYIDAFRRNPTTGLQSVCGVSTGGGHRLFSSTVDLERAVQAGEAAGLLNPAGVELIPLSMDDDFELWDKLQVDKFCARRSGVIQPLRDPDAQRFAHLDLATRNVAGLAICHVVGRQLVDGLYDPKLQKTFSEYRIIVEYDFILALTAGVTKPISFEKIQNFIIWLRERCGFRFGGVSADTFQSVMPLQMLESRNFKVSILSMDRTKGPYYSWRMAFEEGRIRMYRHFTMLREAEALLDLPEKIEHPPEEEGGSKDVCDACAGAYNGAVAHAKGTGSPTGSGPAMYTSSQLETQSTAESATQVTLVKAPDPTRRPSFDV